MGALKGGFGGGGPSRGVHPKNYTCRPKNTLLTGMPIIWAGPPYRIPYIDFNRFDTCRPKVMLTNAS